MADQSVIAVRRAETLARILEALGMEEELLIPSTKAGGLQTELFYDQLLERLATRVLALEILVKRADGHSELLAGILERVESLEYTQSIHEKSIDAVGEAMTVLFKQVSEAIAEGEADDAKADEGEAKAEDSE